MNNKNIKSNESDDGFDEPLIQTQDMNEISPQNNDNISQSKDLISNEEYFDGIDDKNLPKVKIVSNLLSQQKSVNRVEEWRGSQVVNYKTFKKASQKSSVDSQEVIRLKRVENQFRQNKDTIDDPIDEPMDQIENFGKRRDNSETNDSIVKKLRIN